MFEQAVRKKEDKIHWYGIRVFYNRISPFKEALDEYSIRYFIPMHTVEKQIRGQEVSVHEPLVGSLVFVQTTEERLKALQMKFAGGLHPTRIDDEMRYPRQTDGSVLALRTAGAEYLGARAPEASETGSGYGVKGRSHQADSPRPGLIVTVEGVAAFATDSP